MYKSSSKRKKKDKNIFEFEVRWDHSTNGHNHTASLGKQNG